MFHTSGAKPLSEFRPKLLVLTQLLETSVCDLLAVNFFNLKNVVRCTVLKIPSTLNDSIARN